MSPLKPRESLSDLKETPTNEKNHHLIQLRFPPGAEPPEDPFFYDVASASPPMNLKFKFYELDSNRNPIDVDKCFQQAMTECGEREKQFIEMKEDESQGWNSGNIFLDILPRKEGKDYFQNNRPLIRLRLTGSCKINP